MPTLDPETLVNDNLPLAFFIAGKERGLDHHVALSAALEGLHYAAQKFDPERITGGFGCWAAVCIRNRIRNEWAKTQTIMRGARVTIISLDATAPDSEDPIANFVPDETAPDPADTTDSASSHADITQFIDRLPPRTATIIRRHFGIGTDAELLEQIGQSLGLTRERVRQIESNGIHRLRKMINWRGLLTLKHHEPAPAR